MNRLISLLLNKFLDKYSNNISSKAIIGEFTKIRKFTTIDALTTIGMYCFINKNTNITKAKIGNYCSFANNVSIGQGEHIISRISTNTHFYDNAYNELTLDDVEIGHDVWIGTDVIVLRGVKIGNGAVIGANSVVTKDIPPYAVAVGSPARIIKYRFEKEKINLIEKSNWFLYLKEDARKIIQELENSFEK